MLESVTDCVEEAVEEAVPDWVLEALLETVEVCVVDGDVDKRHAGKSP